VCFSLNYSKISVILSAFYKQRGIPHNNSLEVRRRKAMKNHPLNEKYWSENANWKYFCFYICKDDPRLAVPKKPKWMGYTLNFAHPKAYLLLIATIFVYAIPIVMFMGYYGRNYITLLIILVVITMGVMCFYHKQANPRNY
jgi:uncharacterized membrane protein